jgi:polysaccharide pyruvyl transferase WcaK-like protein
VSNTVERPAREAAAPAPRIALWGNFGTLNLGNECTLSAALGGLRRRAPDSELIAVCIDPADTAARHGVRTIPLREPGPARKLRRLVRELGAWRRAFAAAGTFDALMVAGTGVLTDIGEGAFGFPYELFKWALVTRLRRRRMLFVSVGAEAITHPIARFFIGNALRLAHYRSYRDRHSRDLLQSYGFPVADDPVYPDLAFSLAAVAGRTSAAEPGASPVVAVGVYNYRGRGRGSDEAARDYAAYLHWVGSFVLWLLRQGCRVRVILGDYAYDEAVRLDLRRALAERQVRLEQEAYEDEPARSYEQLLEQLRAVDLVVASRFHNVLLSLFIGKPVLSISYDPKNDALMNDIGLGEFRQTLDGVDPARLQAQFDGLRRDASSLGAAVTRRADDYRARLEEQFTEILRVAGAGRAQR